MEELLYVKYFAAFCLVILSSGITSLLIRKLADTIIAIIICGAATLVCWGIYNGEITSWSAIGGISIFLGIVAYLFCLPIIPLSSWYLVQNKNVSTNQPETADNQTK